jgi:hypothetical protein
MISPVWQKKKRKRKKNKQKKRKDSSRLAGMLAGSYADMRAPGQEAFTSSVFAAIICSHERTSSSSAITLLF